MECTAPCYVGGFFVALGLFGRLSQFCSRACATMSSSLLGLTAVLAALATACEGAPASENASFACTHLYPEGVHKIELNGRYFLLLVPSALSKDTKSPTVIDVSA